MERKLTEKEIKLFQFIFNYEQNEEEKKIFDIVNIYKVFFIETKVIDKKKIKGFIKTIQNLDDYFYAFTKKIKGAVLHTKIEVLQHTTLTTGKVNLHIDFEGEPLTEQKLYILKFPESLKNIDLSEVTIFKDKNNLFFI